MRVWLYYRLSNDDDPEQNSLLNQRNICRVFSDTQGHRIVGESSDDNVSGMKFNRRGLDELTAVVDSGKIDAVIVKDLSRLGRHRTQTALFIDYLRERNVRVLSATEGVDTFRDEDDLVIGIRGLMNDYYAKDIGKKIRAGYRQKQKAGIVITPPFAAHLFSVLTGKRTERDRPQAQRHGAKDPGAAPGRAVRQRCPAHA